MWYVSWDDYNEPLMQEEEFDSHYEAASFVEELERRTDVSDIRIYK